MFVQLYTKSVYSLLSSSLKIDEYVERAKEYGLTAIALCDEGNVYGLIKFYRRCKEAGIKPILGLTLNFLELTLVVLAKNVDGYKNILKLATLSQLDGKLTLESVKPYLSNLIKILPITGTPLEQGLSQQTPNRFNDVLDKIAIEDLYVGLPLLGHEEVQQRIRDIAQFYHIPLVYIHEVKALDPLGLETLRYLWAIRDGTKVNYSEYDTNDQRYFIDPKQLIVDVHDEAYRNMAYIANCCEVDLDLNTLHFPKFPTPKGIPSFEYLKALCMKGLEKRLHKKESHIIQVYTERLKYELQVIEQMNFSDYFLVVYDYVKYAKQNGILVGPGRGSAAGSLVSYVLGITNVDPIQYQLLFERFLNPERVSLPDIDIDFEDVRRDDIIKYVQQKYGREHVAHIVAFGTFAARSAVREVAKTMGVSSIRISEITSKLNGLLTIKQNIEQSDELKRLIEEFSEIRRIFTIAERIEGIPRNTTTHAAGIVISGEPLTNLTALSIGLNGVYQTQYEAVDVEAVGLIKMDFLGLRNLSMIHQILDFIAERYGKTINLDQIPLNDAKTYELLARGDTTGIFQLESDGMRRVLRNLGVTHFEDIVAVNALYRPGPSDNIPLFIRRKRGEEPIEYLHPDLKPILESTYGIIVYQEQVMQIARKIANYSLGRADLLRRIISKKQRDALEEERRVFIQGAVQKGYPQKIAETLFNFIVKFGDYGFNRSHSVAYSLISYHLAYLKTHYPTEFMCVLLSSVIGSVSQTKRYIQEARRYNILVLPVSINNSHKLYHIEDNKSIRMGLLALKGLGLNAVHQILEERKKGPFVSYVDFVKRTYKQMKQNVFRALVYSGALDEFGLTKRAMIDNYSQIIDFLRFNPSGYFDEQLTLQRVEEYPLKDLLAQEKSVLGFYLNTHPMRTYISRHAKRDFLTPIEVELSVGEYRKVVGLVENFKEFVTKKGEPMARLTISDELGEVEIVLFPRQYRHITEQQGITIEPHQIVQVSGKLESRMGKIEVIAISIEIIHN